MSTYATTCERCQESATLPTLETLIAYVRQHDETCLPTKVEHRRTGPGRCACGYNAYEIGKAMFFPDYHAMLMTHLTEASITR